MSNTIKVKIKMVPLNGKPSSKDHDVPITVQGTTVGAIAKSLGIDLKNRTVSINGSPATAETLVKEKQKLEVTELRITERPQGS